MPELPEVERASRLLRDAVVGRPIAAVRVLHPSLARRLTAIELATLNGRVIVAVERRGKHQLMRLDDGRVLHAHFRMTGDWVTGRAGDALRPTVRAVIDLADGSAVALDDSRALATLTLHAAGDNPLPALGPEPSDATFTADSLGAALATRRGPIKPALLDQRVVAGLGNIYAAEALWEARISPRAPARSLSDARLRTLVRAIRKVLERAPAARYSDDSRSSRWRVYDREGARCPRHDGTIRRVVQAGRSTYYCPGCQRR